MGLNDRTIWEVQWHPGGGGRFRRLVLTRRGLRRALIALGLAGVLALAIVGALPLGLRGFLTSFTVDAARRDNRALKARRDSLRERSLALAGRVYVQLQRGRRLAWAIGLPQGAWGAPCPAPPAAGAADETAAAWLSQQGARLERLGSELAGAGAGSLRCPLAAMPTGPPINESHAVAVALYGWRLSPFTGKTEAHYGTTLAAPEGEPVLAAGGGRVLFAGVVRERATNDWTRMGNLVVIDHGGEVATVFGHLRDIAVKRGQIVARGDRIGTVGQTGWTRVPALYYELRWPTGGASRPIDPGLVTLSLPVEDLDARLADPSAGLPPEYPALERLPTGGAARPIRRRPVRNDPQGSPRARQ
ncbi:MAG: M23 family metallopeptidase [Acidobacteria bacterium]|nr:MAG: M23 family metallopeptidase [Acidobacteriota bacterium]